MRPHKKPHEITEDKVALFGKVDEQLRSFHREIGFISKKKPSDPLNNFKLGFINQTLTKANELVGDKYRPFPDFTTFDVEGTLPTASDVVMMLDQYLDALKTFKRDHCDICGWNLPRLEASYDIEADEEEDDTNDDGEELDEDGEDDE